MKTTKNLRQLKFLMILIFVLISFFSCQEEATDISLPDDKEAFQRTSEISRLMLRIATNDGSEDDIIDGASCLEVKLPVTVVVNDIEIVIGSKIDFRLIENIYDQFANDTDELEIQFPITILSGDFTETTISNQAELEELIETCAGENEANGNIKCIDFQYPVSISVFNTSSDVIKTKKINNDQELYIFLENLDDNTLAGFNFPVTVMISVDDSIVTVNNNEELISTVNQIPVSCARNDNYIINCTVNSIEVNLKECDWKTRDVVGSVSSILKFNDDSTFIVTNPNGGEEVIGDWNVIIDRDIVYLMLDSTSPDFLGEWEVVDCGDNFLEVTGAKGQFTELIKDCPDSTNLPVVEEFITECKWNMHYLKAGEEDLITQYSDYHFNFNKDGTFIITNSNSEGLHEGTWVAQKIATGGIAISLSSPTLTSDINDYYLLVELNNNKMVLQGEQNHTLKLERACD